MTHHEHTNKEIASDLVKKIRSGRRINEQARCNWCTRTVNQFAFFDERNFVPIPGKKIDGKQALALYGDCCLNDAKKVNDIKYGIRVYKDTDGNLRAEEIDVRFLENAPAEVYIMEKEETFDVVEEDKDAKKEEQKKSKKMGIFD